MTGVKGCPVKIDASGNREKCLEAERAAASAVNKTFAIMGIDVDCPQQVAEFQEGLAFNRRLNIIANKTIVGGAICATTIIVGLIIREVFHLHS